MSERDESGEVGDGRGEAATQQIPRHEAAEPGPDQRPAASQPVDDLPGDSRDGTAGAAGQGQVPPRLRPSAGLGDRGQTGRGRLPGSMTTSPPVAQAPQAARSGPRRALLSLRRVDPWSVLKLSLVLSIALFVVGMVAVAVLYLVLEGMGVPDALNETVAQVTEGDSGEQTIGPILSLGRVLGVTAVIGAVNVVLLTALATLSAFLYNLCADVVGGVEVTLSERE